MDASPAELGDVAMQSEEKQFDGLYATYVPHDIAYKPDFEDSLMQIALDRQSKQNGIRIIFEDSHEAAVDGVSIRASAIATESLPTFTEEELPVPLHDHRRVYNSAVPGVRLTHPHGYMEGGPGLEPDLDTFPDDFASSHPSISTSEQLQQAIAQDVESNVAMFKERMQARQNAKEHNESVEKDIRNLIDQHNMELRVQRKMLDEQKAKKEARDRKRREKEDG